MREAGAAARQLLEAAAAQTWRVNAIESRRSRRLIGVGMDASKV